ncbi:ABC-type transporter, integral membrane subunit [Spirochaeta thermophila DSM 6578]|uniref:ABC-type transporter, integral membrane subunit n=1 Tax=Winmispira thermophila (strain ATCC 700085 / DSM 6578 / Z-1203) TaxID=869211 RepID=G0GF13_WINT7|nr:carbohydrate ABC transporter permease [Spirochaeta thermophila]AEJ62357.1 ABC-type transporter, integral membrane subunit [Spirochaeta thermophila DSM 6578]
MRGVKRYGFSKLIIYSFLIFWSLVTIFPLMVTVFGGLKTLVQLRTDPFGLPIPPRWENYLEVFTDARFLRNLMNSLIIMVITVGIDILLVGFASYALSRLVFPGREVVFNIFLFGLLFPFAVAMLPLYIQIRSMGVLNTYWAVIIPQVAFALPWHIMLTRNFFLQIPLELEEAARMDGCGHLRFLFTIMYPLSTPVLTTIAVLGMVGSWNNFFLPLLVLDDEKLFTLPMGVMAFQGRYQTDWNLVLAFVTLALIPAVLLYFFAQRYIISGLTGGALKE